MTSSTSLQIFFSKYFSTKSRQRDVWLMIIQHLHVCLFNIYLLQRDIIVRMSGRKLLPSSFSSQKQNPEICYYNVTVISNVTLTLQLTLFFTRGLFLHGQRQRSEVQTAKQRKENAASTTDVKMSGSHRMMVVALMRQSAKLITTQQSKSEVGSLDECLY